VREGSSRETSYVAFLAGKSSWDDMVGGGGESVGGVPKSYRRSYAEILVKDCKVMHSGISLGLSKTRLACCKKSFL
jgi:hypothetical protein